MNALQLPLRRNLSLIFRFALIVAALMVVASLAGLLFQSTIYPTEELRQSFVSNDVVNLFIGLPILLGSMALAQRGKLIGLLFWPGTLFYVVYNSIAYAVAMLFNLMFLPHLVLVILGAYTMFSLLISVDAMSIQQQLTGAVPDRFAGGVLIGFGGLFFIRAAIQIASALLDQVSFARPEAALLAADFVITPAWVIGGVMLWRRQAFGYVVGGGLLFQASMLFVGLLIFFILQPFLTGVPFQVADFIVIFIMGLICFIPFGLFVRGIVSAQNQS